MGKKPTFKDMLRESFPVSISDYLEPQEQPEPAKPEETPEQVREIIRKSFSGPEVIHRPEGVSKTISKSDPAPDNTVPHSATVSLPATVPLSDTVPQFATVKIASNYFRQDNDVIDKLPAFQTPAEQIVYRYLYRLAYGWHKPTCFIGLTALIKRCNMSKNTVRQALDGLETKKHIKTLKCFNEKGMKGTMFRVFLPCEISEVESSTCIDRPIS
jgi:hypothetical protein